MSAVRVLSDQTTGTKTGTAEIGPSEPVTRKSANVLSDLEIEVASPRGVTRAYIEGPLFAAALQERDKRLKVVTAELAKPVDAPDRETLKAALELRTADWRDILRGPHVAQARLVLQHLIELPINVINQPVPKWIAAVKPGGLTVGIQSVASPTGFEPVF